MTNGAVEDADALLRVSDRLRFDVYLGPAHELYRDWFDASAPSTIEAARRIVYPLVDRLAPHPSLRGWYLIDEPSSEDRDKTRLAAQAFRERDPLRDRFPVLAGLDRASIFTPTTMAPLVLDVYAVASGARPCDLRMTAFGYPDLGFAAYVREMVARAGKPAQTPLWLILQTHGVEWAGLRQPTVEEVRLQHWLAIGEGAKGIYWFVYSSQQGWTGLRDERALYAEVTRLAERLGPLRRALAAANKTADRFTATIGYTSTLRGSDGRTYVVLANTSCSNASVRVSGPAGVLRDLESGRTHAVGSSVTLSGGDGRVFEFLARR
jgi:hypothetical protein